MVVTLLVTSALLGFATGLVFRVWIIALVSLLIAIGSAILLRAADFGFAARVPVIIGCFVVSQFAYVAGAFMESRFYRAEDLAQDEVDGDPDRRRE